MFTPRKAAITDLDFIVAVDLEDEGVTFSHMAEAGSKELAEHRDKSAAFISDADKTAWVIEDPKANRIIGIILWRYRNRLRETYEGWSIFPEIDERFFSADGAFCEIFQLWVAPEFRRRGLASGLKRLAETESLRHGVRSLYTHTEECNPHVIEMNLKLGYQEVRRGPIWDEVVRVSLIKLLD